MFRSILTIALLACCFHTNANLQRYISLNDDLLINPSRQRFLLNNKVGQMQPCQIPFVSDCWRLNGIVLVPPSSEYNEDFAGSTLDLPTFPEVKITQMNQSFIIDGEQLEGVSITAAHMSKLSEPTISFYHPERGIVFFTFADEMYMVTKRCGLFAAKQCNLRPWLRDILHKVDAMLVDGE